jgi:hypothetical protein
MFVVVEPLASETHRRLDAESLAWGEKVARWRAETGQSEATLREVLNRLTR